MLNIVGQMRLLLLPFGLAVVALLILSACGDGDPAPTPSSSPSPSLTATPTATAALTPTASPASTPSPTTALSPTPEPALSACDSVPSLPTAVSDQADLYSISVPDGWTLVTDEGPQGVRVSRIEVESPDFSVLIDEAAEGPFSPVYYETGATLVIHVISPPLTPAYHFSGVISESEVTVDGVTAPYHVFTEPSTRAGQLIDAHLTQGSNYYLFKLGYNPETCPVGEDLFHAILDSFQLN
jgi:hypothetical protein